MNGESRSKDGLFGEPEGAAYWRLLADNLAALRSDVRWQPDEILQLAALILTDGTRRRLSGVHSPDADADDVRRLQEIFGPGQGLAGSGTPSDVFA